MCPDEFPLLGLSLPKNESPRLNKILSPALNETLLTLSIVFQGEDVDLPELESLPELLT